jgi:hemerythrin-like domain-containing protein
MNAAEIKAVLKTVEQDHQLVLDKMQALKETVSGLLEPNTPTRRALDQLRQLERYFVTQFTTHLEEEEVTLFPLMEQCQPEGPELVTRLREEHSTIRHQLEEFGNCLDVALQLDEPPRAVLRDLLAYGWDFLVALDKHAHAETQGVHLCLARSFRDDGECAAPRAAAKRS